MTCSQWHTALLYNLNFILLRKSQTWFGLYTGKGKGQVSGFHSGFYSTWCQQSQQPPPSKVCLQLGSTWLFYLIPKSHPAKAVPPISRRRAWLPDVHTRWYFSFFFLALIPRNVHLFLWWRTGSVIVAQCNNLCIKSDRGNSWRYY